MLTLENTVLRNSTEEDVVSVLGPLVPVPCHRTVRGHIGKMLLPEVWHLVLAE